MPNTTIRDLSLGIAISNGDLFISRQGADVVDKSVTGTQLKAYVATEGYAVGPASSTDNAVVRFDGTTGKLLQNSTVTIDDSGNVNINGNVSVQSANGRIWGIANLAAGHTIHFQYGGDSFNEIENTYGGNAKFKSYHGTEIISATTGGVIGPCLAVLNGQADKVVLVARAALGQTENLFSAQDTGGNTRCSIDKDGRIRFDYSLSSVTSPGSIWWDVTRNAITTYVNNIQQSFVGTIFTATADRTVTNTTSESTILGTGIGTLTLPSDFFNVGKTIRLRVGGVYSTPLAATPSLVIKVKYGSTVLATVTTTSLLSGATNLEFDGEILITCRSTGGSGTVMVHGDIEYATGIGGTISVDPLNNAGATTTINTTTSNALDITVTWDTATATRIAKSTSVTVEVLN